MRPPQSELGLEEGATQHDCSGPSRDVSNTLTPHGGQHLNRILGGRHAEPAQDLPLELLPEERVLNTILQNHLDPCLQCRLWGVRREYSRLVESQIVVSVDFQQELRRVRSAARRWKQSTSYWCPVKVAHRGLSRYGA